MSDLFLPKGEVWIGFDEGGMSIAASIEKRKPSSSKGSVMEGCATVKKCRLVDGETVFGRHVTTLEVLK